MPIIDPKKHELVRERTKKVYDRKKRGRVIGEQVQETWLLGAFDNAFVDVTGVQFEEVPEQTFGDNTIGRHFRGKLAGADVFLRGGIEPGQTVLRGRVEVKVQATANTFSLAAIGESDIREDSRWEYLWVTFLGEADLSAAPKEILPENDRRADAELSFGPARRGNFVHVCEPLVAVNLEVVADNRGLDTMAQALNKAGIDNDARS